MVNNVTTVPAITVVGLSATSALPAARAQARRRDAWYCRWRQAT